MTELEDLSGLLGRGGWEIVDPRTVTTVGHDTDNLPDDDALATLAQGSTVRAMFRVATIADVVRDGIAPYDADGRPVLVSEVERLWAIVTGVGDDEVDCVLTSQPFGTHTSLAAYHRLRVPSSHLLEIGPAEPDLDGFLTFLARWEGDPENAADPTDAVDPVAAPRIRGDQQEVCDRVGARAEPPWPFGRGLLAKNVTPGSVLVYGARFVADAERQDTGWVVYADHSDFEHVSATVGFTVATLEEIYRAHPAVWPFVALPTGWGFTLAGGAEEVYPVEVAD